MKKLITAAAVVFVVLAIVNNPDGAADAVTDATSAVSTFVDHLTD